jgi:hypothetical protein
MLGAVDKEFGTLPIAALNDVAVLTELLEWQDKVAKVSGEREADNRLSVLSSALTWANSRQKHLVVCLVKEKFLELGVDRYVFVAESWTANRTGDESTDILPPSQAPNRQECIFIHAEEKGGLSKTGQFPINRDGEKVSTGEFIHFEEGPSELGTTFSNMFGEDAFH